MISFIEKRRRNWFFKGVSCLIIVTLTVMPATPVMAQSIVTLPVPGTMITPTTTYYPPLINGLTINTLNPFQFEFLIDVGDNQLEGEAFRSESDKLIKYFLASLTTPEEEMWVNLSPYEANRIIPDNFGRTEMGRDLLAQDYLLKQLTASLMYPESDSGREFWKQINAKLGADQKISKEQAIDTFNKVWIVPERAVIYEHENSVFVVDSYLKVMLEEDYEALQSNAESRAVSVENNQTRGISSKEKSNNWRKPLVSDDSLNETRDDFNSRQETTQIIREIIIPAIEAEVNEGQTFANLRQIFNSMVLATWYKQNLKETVLGQIYVDQSKTKFVDTKDSQANQKIYEQYLEAFKVGVYDYIKEEYDPATQAMIPRKYFSGGAKMSDKAMTSQATPLQLARFTQRAALKTTVTAEVESPGMDLAGLVIDEAMTAEDLALELQATLDTLRELSVALTPQEIANRRSGFVTPDAVREHLVELLKRGFVEEAQTEKGADGYKAVDAAMSSESGADLTVYRNRKVVYDQETGESLTLRSAVIADLLDLQGQTRSNEPAIIYPTENGYQSDTFKQLNVSAYQNRRELESRGVRQGDSIAVLSPNSYPYAKAALGAWNLGATVVALNFGLLGPEAPENAGEILDHMLSVSQAKHLLVFGPMLKGAREKLGDKYNDLNVLVYGPVDESDLGANESLYRPNVQSTDKLLSNDIKPTDVALVQFTSGTTSMPKMVPTTHQNLMFNREASRLAWEDSWTEDKTTLGWLPYFHVMGFPFEFLGSLYNGGTYAFPNYQGPPTPQKLIDAIKASGSNIFFTVPKMLKGLRQMAENDPEILKVLQGLDFIMSGGDVLDPEVGQWLEDNGVTVVQGMGMTEVAGALFLSVPTKDGWQALRPIPGIKMRFDEVQGIDGDERELVIVDSPTVTSGYAGNFEATEEVFKSDGFHTGDLFIEVGNNLYVHVGRFDDVEKTSVGEKVIVKAIEFELKNSPLIEQVAVIAKGHDYPMAIVQVNRKAFNEGAAEENIRLQIEEVFENVNATREKHERIRPGNIVILEEGRELPLAPKGSLVRKAVPVLFAAEIAGVYGTDAAQLSKDKVFQVQLSERAAQTAKATDNLRDIVKRTTQLDLLIGLVDQYNNTDNVTLDGESLNIARLAAIAHRRVDIVLNLAKKEGVDASVKFLADALRKGDHIYGVTSGFGGSADTITRRTSALQEELIRFLNAGYGKELPNDVILAAMVIRSNSNIKGASGLRWEVLNNLKTLINNGMVPYVPKRGSITASGDLVPLSHIMAVLMGKESATVKYKGEVISAKEALRIAGLKPVVLGPKEGLAFVNGTSVANAYAALVMYNVNILASLAQAATALSIESLLGTNESYGEFVQAMKPHATQKEVGSNLVNLLKGSKLSKDELGGGDAEWNAGHMRQDRYALRTTPQWLGPQLDVILQATEAVTIESNSATDNPLLDPKTGKSYHGGNFQGTAVAVPMDNVRLALQSIGKLIFAQYEEMVNKAFNNGLPPNLAGSDNMGEDFGLKGAEIALASYMSELAFLGNPVTNHVQSAELHNQDVNSLGLISARYTADSVEVLQMLMANHLYAAMQAIDLRNIERHYQTEVEEAIEEAVDNMLGSIVENVDEIAPLMKRHLIRKVRQITPYSYAFERGTNRYSTLYKELAGEVDDVLRSDPKSMGDNLGTITGVEKTVDDHMQSLKNKVANGKTIGLELRDGRVVLKAGFHIVIHASEDDVMSAVSNVKKKVSPGSEIYVVNSAETQIVSDVSAVVNFNKDFKLELAQRLDEHLPRAKKQALEEGAANLLGNTRPLYEFVRDELGVRFEQGDQDPGPEQAKIFEAIRDGRIVKPLLEAMAGKEQGVFDAAQLTEARQFINNYTNPALQTAHEQVADLGRHLRSIDPHIIDQLKEPEDIFGGWSRVKLKSIDQVWYDADIFHVRVVNNTLKGPGKGGIRWVTAKDLVGDGVNPKSGDKKFKKALETLNDLGATEGEVGDFLQKYITQKTEALALGMTKKPTNGLGGAKGSILIANLKKDSQGKWILEDYENWDDSENQAEIARSHSRELILSGKIGVDRDIPAPDVRTNPDTMSWYADEYVRVFIPEIKKKYSDLGEVLEAIKVEVDNGEYIVTDTPFLNAIYDYWYDNHVPMPWLGVFTGKAAAKGGALGRDVATGYGVIDVMLDVLGELDGETVAVQGFGNVGRYTALRAAEFGATVKIISDYDIALVNEKGWTKEQIQRIIDVGRLSKKLWEEGAYGFSSTELADVTAVIDSPTAATEAVLYADVDVLVPAALGGDITEDNEENVQAKWIFEAANGPVTTVAEKNLTERGITVVPDTLVNAGGVIVSSLETVQAVNGKPFTWDEVNDIRAKSLRSARAQAQQIRSQNPGMSFRMAYDIYAIREIIKAKYLSVIKKYKGDIFEIRRKLESDKDLSTIRSRIIKAGLQEELEAAEDQLIASMKSDITDLIKSLRTEQKDSELDALFDWLIAQWKSDHKNGFIDFKSLEMALNDLNPQDQARILGYRNPDNVQKHREDLAKRLEAYDEGKLNGLRDFLIVKLRGESDAASLAADGITVQWQNTEEEFYGMNENLRSIYMGFIESLLGSQEDLDGFSKRGDVYTRVVDGPFENPMTITIDTDKKTIEASSYLQGVRPQKFDRIFKATIKTFIQGVLTLKLQEGGMNELLNKEPDLLTSALSRAVDSRLLDSQVSISGVGGVKKNDQEFTTQGIAALISTYQRFGFLVGVDRLQLNFEDGSVVNIIRKGVGEFEIDVTTRTQKKLVKVQEAILRVFSEKEIIYEEDLRRQMLEAHLSEDGLLGDAAMTAQEGEKQLVLQTKVLDFLKANLNNSFSSLEIAERLLMDFTVDGEAVEGVLDELVESGLISSFYVGMGFYNFVYSENESTESDPAQVGGIDLNPNNMSFDRQGSKIKMDPSTTLRINPAMLQNIHIEGLRPVIINIAPVLNLPLLLGLTDAEDANPYADTSDQKPFAALKDEYYLVREMSLN